MRVLNDHTSSGAVAGLVDWILELNHVALLSDGGAPTVSDPGTTLIDVAHEEGIQIEVVPGPSAVIAALASSGFFGQRFTFFGFPPRKAGEIRSLFQPFEQSTQTLVFFESPFRFRSTLEVLAERFPNRRYAICRELTKLHEQIFRSTLPELPSEADVPAKGEFTIVIEGQRSTKHRAAAS
jgi:16S rRNA (cytidine1402-2'-O)-methyltransferase